MECLQEKWSFGHDPPCGRRGSVSRLGMEYLLALPFRLTDKLVHFFQFLALFGENILDGLEEFRHNLIVRSGQRIRAHNSTPVSAPRLHFRPALICACPRLPLRRPHTPGEWLPSPRWAAGAGSRVLPGSPRQSGPPRGCETTCSPRG